MAGAMFKKIDGENCSMNKIVHFIGFDGNGFSAAVKVWGRPDFIHKFFDKRSLGDIDFDNDTVVFGRKTKLTPHTLSGLTKTTTDIEKGRHEPPFFYMRIIYGVENF